MLKFKPQRSNQNSLGWLVSIEIKVTHVDDMGTLGHFYKWKCELIQLLLKPNEPHLWLQFYFRVYTPNKSKASDLGLCIPSGTLETTRQYTTQVPIERWKQKVACKYDGFLLSLPKKLNLALYPLTKNDRPFEWGEKEQAAFDTIKTVLMWAPALGLPDVSKPFHLYVAESGGVAKGVLMQKLRPWKRPVAYLSKKLDSVAAGRPACLRIVAALSDPSQRCWQVDSGARFGGDCSSGIGEHGPPAPHPTPHTTTPHPQLLAH